MRNGTFRLQQIAAAAAAASICQRQACQAQRASRGGHRSWFAASALLAGVLHLGRCWGSGLTLTFCKLSEQTVCDFCAISVHCYRSHAEDRGRPQQEGLARRPRRQRQHHPLKHRRCQGRGQGTGRGTMVDGSSVDQGAGMCLGLDNTAATPRAAACWRGSKV